jgi:hypothetical protein
MAKKFKSQNEEGLRCLTPLLTLFQLYRGGKSQNDDKLRGYMTNNMKWTLTTDLNLI